MTFLYAQKKILRKFCLVDLGIRSQTIYIPSKRLITSVKEDNYDEESIEVNTDFNVHKK